MVIKRWYLLLFEVAFFIVIFVITINPLRDFDIWFHLKSGEVFSQRGIIFKDVFSYSAQGRKWYPYEWLYQVIIYQFKQIFGFEAIKYFTALLYSLISLTIYITLRKLFKLKAYFAALLIFFFVASTFEFYAARPQSLAYLFFSLNLFLILRYYFEGKNYLLLTLPFTLLWSNLHGSIFLNVLLFIGFAGISLLNYLTLKQTSWLKKSKILILYAALSFILSILPPLGFTQYELLWRFFQDRLIISNYISEWTPLTPNQLPFYIFSSELILTLGILYFTIKKQRIWQESLWVIIGIAVAFSGYLANRNTFLSYILITLLLGWAIAKWDLKSTKKFSRLILTLGVIIFFTANLWIYTQKSAYSQNLRLYYPVSATVFIKNYLNGHMFNEYGYGGYLLYNLYPQKQVFVDGRTDVYLCCEMVDLLNIDSNKFLSDSDYKNVLDKLWNKYDISYVLIRTQKNTVLRKIGRILTDDPNWNLVFWDDFSEIFVRKDGKNDQVLKELSTKAATPYDQDLFRPNMEDQALSEYQKMDSIVDSARSHNAIGFIYLKQNKFDLAKDEFVKALSLDPTFESPYMNLAELAAKDQDLDQAINLYQKALSLAPDRGLIYIRLGQLTLQQSGDLVKARQIWQDGLDNTADDQAKKQLQSLIQS